MENKQNTNTANDKIHNTSANTTDSTKVAIFSGSGRKVFNSTPTPALIKEYLKFSYNYGLFAIVNGVLFIIVMITVLILVGWVLLIIFAFGGLSSTALVLPFVLIPFIGSIYSLVRGIKLIRRKLTREKQISMTGWMIFYAVFQAIPCIFLGFIILRNLLRYPDIVSIIFFCVFVVLTLNSCAMIFFSIKFRSKLNHEYFSVAQSEDRRVASKVISSSHESETSSRESE